MLRVDVTRSTRNILRYWMSETWQRGQVRTTLVDFYNFNIVIFFVNEIQSTVNIN